MRPRRLTRRSLSPAWRDAEGELLLRAAIAALPREAAAHHALGLNHSQTGSSRMPRLLNFAARPSCNRQRCDYSVYAVALIPPVTVRGRCGFEGQPGSSSERSRHAAGVSNVQSRGRRRNKRARLRGATPTMRRMISD